MVVEDPIIYLTFCEAYGNKVMAIEKKSINLRFMKAFQRENVINCVTFFKSNYC